MPDESDLHFEYIYHDLAERGICASGHYELRHKPTGIVLSGPELQWNTNKAQARQSMRSAMGELLKKKAI